MNDERNSTLCFSGHRYYTCSEIGAVRLTEALEAAYRDGYRTFISGMAAGFDLAAAEAVLHLRDSHPDVKLIAAVPFARQAAKYSGEDRARYDALLAVVDETRVLSEGYSYGCYYRRDDRMVERSGRIICWYDNSGGLARMGGGTRYTVRKAVAAGLEIVNLFRPQNSLF